MSCRNRVISWKVELDSYVVVPISYKCRNISYMYYIVLSRRDSRVTVQHSYKLARTHRNVAGMSCGPRSHIVEHVQVSNNLVENRKNLLIFRHEYRGHVV